MGKGEKITAQPQQQVKCLPERKGDADTWLLSFQSICHAIKSLAWELIKEFSLVFLQPAAIKPI